MPPAAGLPMLLRPGLNRRRSSACAAARPGPPAGHRTLRSGLHRPLCFTQASQLLQQLFPDRDRAPDDVVHNRDAPALPRPTERSRDVIAEIHPDQLNPPVMIQRRYPRSPLHGRTACAPGPGHPWIRGESGRRSRDLAGIMAQRSSPPAVNEPPLAGGPGPSGPVPSRPRRIAAVSGPRAGRPDAGPGWGTPGGSWPASRRYRRPPRPCPIRPPPRWPPRRRLPAPPAPLAPGLVPRE